MKVKVTVVNNEPYDCDCCGTIYSSDATIEYEDGRVTELYEDNHFGGDWDGTEVGLYKEILEELGIEVEINYEQEEDDW